MNYCHSASCHAVLKGLPRPNHKSTQNQRMWQRIRCLPFFSWQMFWQCPSMALSSPLFLPKLHEFAVSISANPHVSRLNHSTTPMCLASNPYIMLAKWLKQPAWLSLETIVFYELLCVPLQGSHVSPKQTHHSYHLHVKYPNTSQLVSGLYRTITPL